MPNCGAARAERGLWRMLDVGRPDPRRDSRHWSVLDPIQLAIKAGGGSGFIRLSSGNGRHGAAPRTRVTRLLGSTAYRLSPEQPFATAYAPTSGNFARDASRRPWESRFTDPVRAVKLVL
jgi:hypothetical protein